MTRKPSSNIEEALRKLQGLTREERRLRAEKLQRRILDLSQQDRERICTGFREIETDLASEVIEAYQERRMADFADALDHTEGSRRVAFHNLQ